MELPEGEPAASDWRMVDVDALVDQVLAASTGVRHRPRLMAVDGRGASGKSTLAARIGQHTSGVEVVHTDDLAWHEPYFRWGHLLRDEVLEPLRAGHAVDFQPPAWKARGRGGSISVSAAAALVVIEGVGANQREVEGLLDFAVWVQSDFKSAEERGIARDIAEGANGPAEAAVAFWHEWMREELAFLRRDRPWERADVIVNGTPPQPAARGRLAIARGPLIA